MRVCCTIPFRSDRNASVAHIITANRSYLFVGAAMSKYVGSYFCHFVVEVYFDRATSRLAATISPLGPGSGRVPNSCARIVDDTVLRVRTRLISEYQICQHGRLPPANVWALRLIRRDLAYVKAGSSRGNWQICCAGWAAYLSRKRKVFFSQSTLKTTERRPLDRLSLQ